jgi:hypothetical protein
MRGSRAHTTLAVLAGSLLALALFAGAAASAPDPDPTNVQGSLLDSGELSGTVEIDFSVNTGANYTGTITVDGTQLVSSPVTQGSGHLYLDTAQLLDGSHSVVVAVGEGATSDVVWSGTIATRNAPEGGVPSIAGSSEVGATLTAQAGSWHPQPTALGYQWRRCASAGDCSAIAGATRQSYVVSQADTNAQLEVEVTASDDDGSTAALSSLTAVVVQPGAAASGSANGSDPCADAQLAAEIGSGRSLHIALGQHATVHGRLDCAGTPITGAAVQLALTPARGDAPAAHADVQTASDGSFSYAVPPGPSRDITLTYDAYVGATTPAAVATLALLVRPRITLRIAPKRTTNGHSVTLRGRVFGGHIARAGLPLEIEYREGRRWMVYTEVLARPAGGRFRWRYTFQRTTESITYTFRVAIPATGVAGYPYQPAASPSRSVHVVP